MPTPPKVGVCDADASLFKGVCDLWTPPEWECAKPTPPKVGVCDADASLFKGVCENAALQCVELAPPSAFRGEACERNAPWPPCALLP